MLKPYQRHLASSSDLVTTYEARRAGFIAFALEKNRRATPYVEQARILKASVALISRPADLLAIETIQPALLAAAGLSDKAIGHLQPADKMEAIQGLVERFLEPAGSGFAEELIYRFLLTRGDALGGSMRNVGGAIAQQKLTRAVLAALALGNVPYRWLHSLSRTWLPGDADDLDIDNARHLRGVYWERDGQPRTLLYNANVLTVKNNVDLSLLAGAPMDEVRPENYLALGELKGGIDPAGADEHWKTARTALARIRQAFQKQALTPHTCFVGAAIEKKMAQEIWDDLEQGVLTNAANLTNADQLASFCLWLVRL